MILSARGFAQGVYEMRIEVDKLLEGTRSFTHDYAPGELILEDERVRLSGPAHVEGWLTRKEREVQLRGTLSARAEVECDRCLKPVEIPVEADFDVAYTTESDYAASETAELQADDLRLSVYDGEAIELDDLVSEQILLALPPRTLCREDCRGLCPSCGADRNIEECRCETVEVDPRWAALASLKEGEEGPLN